MQDFEKLGAFYLGKAYDPQAGSVSDDLVMYDAKDLTTHAVIVGMTGSGKTGLGIGMIEEAAIDGVPVIAIDPKGDLGNLLLTFPDLAAADFRPWIDEAEAARKGQTPDAFAADAAASWKKGLASWGQDPARIARFRDAADAVIYTPGSNAGMPLAVLKSFAAPPAAIVDDPEALRERVASTTSGLLALLGIDADPVKSREHILVSNLLENAWKDGRDLDVAGLIRAIQTPPFDRLGVLDLDAFFPPKDRFALATALNGMVAAPGFSAWTQGEPLDVARLLWTPAGKPRVSVISISHLNDAERMFFVTSLLNEVIGWMRAQSGTSSLRAMLYMDEVFGYFPPTANPPSKTPMLTLLKQARAFGLGVVLATQNPVDLDYKGLGNAGTWFLGRLQTERDKARVVDGLEGASAAAQTFDRARLDATLSALKSRTFLMVNAHDDAPTLFQTRWTLSYLRGPLTKPQIQSLCAARKAAAPAPAAGAPIPYGVRVSAPTAASAAAATASGTGAGSRPLLPPDVPEYFLAAADGEGRVEYRPAIQCTAKVHYADAKSGVDTWETITAQVPVPSDLSVDPWDGADVVDGKGPELTKAAVAGAVFAPLSSSASKAKSYAAWQKALEEWIYRTRTLTAYRCTDPKAMSRPGETDGDFRVRLAHGLREERDAAVDALRKKYATKVQALQERIRVANERVAREKAQASSAKWSTAISFGASILGALFGGRKTLSAGNIGRATTAARGVGRAQKESADVGLAEESVEAVQQRLKDLQAQVEAEVAAIQDAGDGAGLELLPVKVAAKKGDLTSGAVALVWTPYRDGSPIRS